MDRSVLGSTERVPGLRSATSGFDRAPSPWFSSHTRLVGLGGGSDVRRERGRPRPAFPPSTAAPAGVSRGSRRPRGPSPIGRGIQSAGDLRLPRARSSSHPDRRTDPGPEWPKETNSQRGTACAAHVYHHHDRDSRSDRLRGSARGDGGELQAGARQVPPLRFDGARRSRRGWRT